MTDCSALKIPLPETEITVPNDMLM